MEFSVSRMGLRGIEKVGAFALLDRLTHHVHILEMDGENYRLKQARDSKKAADRSRPNA